MSDWQNINPLDGIGDPIYVSKLKKSRTDLQNKSQKVKVDFDAVMEHLWKTSNVFDVIRLPKQKIKWLENLGRLLDHRKIRGDGSEVRWRIFKICESVEKTWESQWAPRQPLDWEKG
jgi:hypothetical protein